MDNLILSFNVVLPLCLSILLGYFLLRIGMIDGSVQKSLNRLCFKVFLPVYVFNNIYTTNISTAFHPPLILLSVLGIFFLFLSMMLLIPRLEPVPAKCGVIIQAIFRSNYALFGLPVAASLCGEQNLGPTTLLLGIVVPLFNVFAVICLESFRGGKPSIRKILRGIAVNPLIIASALGIAANLLNIHLPSGVHKCITDLGRIATPLSLVVLGDVSLALYEVLGGGVVIAAFFMATDYSTTPINARGKMVFAFGCGVFTVLIRFLGAYPEGVSFAILIMNILAPYIEKLCAKKPFGKAGKAV